MGYGSGLPAGTYKVPSDGTSGRPTLFASGYCDVMPLDEAQLQEPELRGAGPLPPQGQLVEKPDHLERNIYHP